MVVYSEMTSNIVDHTGNPIKNAASLLSHPSPWCGAGGMGMRQNETDGGNKVYNYCTPEDKEKTPMCRIAELCRYHKIKHEYKLMDESGPAHKKMFTVHLVFSAEEKFEGVGGSIKKAQQNAAMVAIRNTKRTFPPLKVDKTKKKTVSSPCILLRHAARRLGLPEPVYSRPDAMFKRPIPQPQGAVRPIHMGPPLYRGHPPVDMRPMPGYTGPSSIPSQTHYDTFNDRNQVAILSIGNQHPVFSGVGHTFQLAKVNSALQGLMYLGPSLARLDNSLKEREKDNRMGKQQNNISKNVDDQNEKEDREDDNGSDSSDPSSKNKSVISRLHECALQLRLNVEFEVLVEEGPTHNRHYVVRCRLIGSPEYILSADGEGRNKKSAKQAACSAVLAKVYSLEQSPLFIASTLYKNDKNRHQPKEQKRKTIVKDKKMDPDYGHQINPVSRLMQVVQTRGESEPRFEVIREQGQNRYKEFVMEVSWGDLCCQGTGPNKRLAKRAAAEAILAEIGYVKPMPTPGKSLLKRREEDMQMNIGVFDLTEVMQNLSIESKEVEPGPISVPVVSLEKPVATWKEITIEASNDASIEADCSSEVSPNETRENGDAESPTNEQKRRVTFSNQVAACPPPDDSSYPIPQVAPLKSEVVVVGKLRRKGRDGKRVLTQEQKLEIRCNAQAFLNVFCHETRVALVPAKQADETNDSSVSAMQMETARRRLDTFSEAYKFSVQYTNFPKTPGDGRQDEYFALASLGLEKPIVAHGSGDSQENAADNAAYNALLHLAQIGGGDLTQ